MTGRERRIRGLLQDAAAPAENEARERAWRVTREAWERREPPATRARPRRLALAAAAASLAALVVTPPGQAVGDWVRDELGRDRVERPEPRPALTSLPAPGAVLALAGENAWTVSPEGSKRLLGRYDDAAWSPRGRFVAAARGGRLAALTPRGDVRWTVSRPVPVAAPRWSPSGFRVAYLSGPLGRAPQRPLDLRVVAGDGTGDRPLIHAAARTAPAWRPGKAHVLAYADARGRVIVHDVDARRRVWATEPGERPVQIAWSADGERLAGVGRRTLRIFDGRGRALSRLPAGVDAAPPAPERSRLLAFERRGHRFALIRKPGAAGEVVLLRAERRPGRPRPLIAGPGAFDGVAWSPDGRWLLVSWPSADQWLFIAPAGSRSARPASRVSADFDPGPSARPGFPAPAGWCCPP